MSLKRGQGRHVPVMTPFQHASLVNLVLVREIFTHTRDDQRMSVASDDLCKTTDSRAGLRVFRQEWRVWMFLVEIFKDSERFKKYRAVILDQCWNCHHRVDFAELSFPLMAFH